MQIDNVNLVRPLPQTVSGSLAKTMSAPSENRFDRYLSEHADPSDQVAGRQTDNSPATDDLEADAGDSETCPPWMAQFLAESSASRKEAPYAEKSNIPASDPENLSRDSDLQITSSVAFIEDSSDMSEAMEQSNRAGQPKGSIQTGNISNGPGDEFASRIARADMNAQEILNIDEKQSINLDSRPLGEVFSTESGTNFMSDPPSASPADLSAINSLPDQLLQQSSSQTTAQHNLPRIANQIVAHLTQNMGSQTSVELSPIELGNLRFNITQGERVSIQVIVERPETLELIRRHIDLFYKELRDMGFESSEFTFAENQRQPPREEEAQAKPSETDKSIAPAPRTASIRPLPISAGRIDLKL